MATTPIPARPPGEPPTVFQTSPNRVLFDPKAVVPSQPIYLQRNDLIFIIASSNAPNAQFLLEYRYLTPDGEIKEGTFQSRPFAGTQPFTFTLYEGWLLSFVIECNNVAVPGQWAYAQVGLARGAAGNVNVPQLGLIWQGYVPNQVASGWPGQPSKEFQDGPGTIRSITGTTPAAGVDINEVVPVNRRWTLLAFRAQLTASATVANRFPGFQLDDGTNVLFLIHSSQAQTAGQTFAYDLAPGNQFFNDTNSHILIPFPTQISMKSGFHLRSATVGIQATDQWTAPQYLVYEWGMWDT